MDNCPEKEIQLLRKALAITITLEDISHEVSMGYEEVERVQNETAESDVLSYTCGGATTEIEALGGKGLVGLNTISQMALVLGYLLDWLRVAEVKEPGSDV